MLTAKIFEFVYKLIHLGSIDILTIWKDKKIKLYKLTEFKADPEFCGRAFRLDKIDSISMAAEIRSDENFYNVLVSSKPWECRCDCIGSQRWGLCVHRLSLEDMIIDAAHKLQSESEEAASASGL